MPARASSPSTIPRAPISTTSRSRPTNSKGVRGEESAFLFSDIRSDLGKDNPFDATFGANADGFAGASEEVGRARQARLGEQSRYLG